MRPADIDIQQLLHTVVFMHRLDHLHIHGHSDKEPLRLLGMVQN